MTGKSAHRDVALWRYERPSRGYFGLHLRAQSPSARTRLKDRLAALTPKTPHLLRFGTLPPDTQPWPRIAFPDALIILGSEPPTEAASLSFAIEADQLADLMTLLETVAPHEESCVTVQASDGAMPLWVWWDA